MPEAKTIETSYSVKLIDARPDGIQPRVSLNPDTVKHYAELMKEGETDFPPVRLFDIAGHGVRIADGYHRVAAAKLVGQARIKARITVGTMAECIEEAYWANSGNGVPFTMEERKEGVRRIARECRQAGKPVPSVRHLGKVCGISHETARRVLDHLNSDTTARSADSFDISDRPGVSQVDAGEAGDDWANRDEPDLDPIAKAEEEHLKRQAKMAGDIHDQGVYADALRIKIGEVRKLFEKQAGNEAMGHYYRKHLAEVLRSLEFLTKVTKMCTAAEMCPKCEGEKCAYCGDRGWLTREQAKETA